MPTDNEQMLGPEPPGTPPPDQEQMLGPEPPG